VSLDGGGELVSTDLARGPVAATIDPWEVAIEPAAAPTAPTSARNRLPATVATVTPLGNRSRIGLETPQPLTAELTGAAVRDLQIAPGDRVTATWKATATRLVPR
jgi:molybdate transport system ATP-binding protein